MLFLLKTKESIVKSHRKSYICSFIKIKADQNQFTMQNKGLVKLFALLFGIGKYLPIII